MGADDDKEEVAGDEEGMETSPEIRRSGPVDGREGTDLEKSGGGSGALAPGTGGGYDVYAAYIKDELEVQEKRKASFEQRGLAVITTSGTLVTLLFALAALSTKEADTFSLPAAAEVLLAAALICFFLSAFAALATNAPLRYDALVASKVRERLRDESFTQTAAAATRDVAFTRLKELESAKDLNGLKGKWLTAAMAWEALGVGLVGAAILIVIL
jgi:hypothetical protein